MSFPSSEAFYAARPERLRSPELDFGVQWIDGGSTFVRQRVSYVDATRELYAVTLNGPTRNAVELLAVFPLEPCDNCGGRGVFTPEHDGATGSFCHRCGGTGNSRRLVETALLGWAEVCGTPGSLAWVRERVARVAAVVG
jgi:hypothetical protein